MTRQAGAPDPVHLHGRGRDLLTTHDGAIRELNTARFDATIDRADRKVRSVVSTPNFVGLSGLSGAPAMSGFRAALDRCAPQLRQQRELLYTLLDDIPVVTLISGHALAASGLLGAGARSGYLPSADQCAGFVTGGLLMSSYDAGDPAVVTGPVAPDIDDDPHGWHLMAHLPTHGMRRRRRLDVSKGGRPRIVDVDAMFRDTYVRGDCRETIIHEYTLTAKVHTTSGEILQAAAAPRVLPWQECPAAAASAGAIVGMTMNDLHLRVRNELHGTATCTHLNDLLRSVSDVQALIGYLPDN